jgi:mannan endo-1,4-beta-mannosidase
VRPERLARTPGAGLLSWVPFGLRAVTAIFGLFAIAVVVLYPIIGPPRHGVTTADASSRENGRAATSDALRHPGEGRSRALAGGGASGASTPSVVPPTPATPPPVAASPPKAASSTSSPTTTDPPAQRPEVPSGIIGVSGDNLTLNGSAYRFTGVNAYEIGTDWGTNAGCGADVSDAQLDQFFASLRPNSLVRFWAFQGTMATNATTGQIDWAPLDRVFATAAAYGQRLIPVLTDQGGTCDAGHWQDPAWYEGGFEQVYDDPSPNNGVNLTPLSYWDYLQAIVNRYKSSPALGMWEPISEAEASTCAVQDEPGNCSGNQTCPNEEVAAQALRHFFDVVGAEIHALDPDHLVESGLLGGGQCGTSGSDYQFVSASPGIDVLSYHDYYAPGVALGGDQWNGLAVRFAQAQALGKPIIGGEVGIISGTGTNCLSDAQRSNDVQARVEAQMPAGSSGILLWNWVPSLTQACSFDIAPGDPSLSVLDTVAL